MKNLRSNTISFIFWGTISIVSCIIVGTAFVFYREGRVNLNGVDHELFGQFGDFIGGFGGTIINFTGIIFLWLNYNEQKKDLEETKRLTRLQIDLSLKPDMLVLDTGFKALTSVSQANNAYPVRISNNEMSLGQAFSPQLDISYIKVINVGIAVAKNIECQWQFDLAKMIEFTNSLPGPDDITIEELKTGNGVEINISSNLVTVFVSNPYLNKSFVSLAMPYKGSEDIKWILFPGITQSLYFISKKRAYTTKSYEAAEEHMDKFPTCTLKLWYDDIADNPHYKEFVFTSLSLYETTAKNEGEIMMSGRIIGRSVNH
jgi:hypothetical protein